MTRYCQVSANCPCCGCRVGVPAQSIQPSQTAVVLDDERAAPAQSALEAEYAEGYTEGHKVGYAFGQLDAKLETSLRAALTDDMLDAGTQALQAFFPKVHVAAAAYCWKAMIAARDKGHQ